MLTHEKTIMLTHEDKELLAKKGISEEKIAEQLACFEKGFPFLKLSAAASVENGGIMRADEKECEQYLAAWDAYKAGDKKIVKFVPASGAASHGMHTRQAIRKSSSLFRLRELPAVCSRICSNSWELSMTNLLLILRRNSSITFMILHSTMT